MKRRRLGFGGRMCARQPPWNPCRPAPFDRRMGKAGYGGRPFGTDRPLPKAAVPALETLREHNPQLSERVRRRQLHASSLFETRRFSDRKPA